jgi:hypothetical protein
MFSHSGFQTAGANPGQRTVSLDLPGLFKHPLSYVERATELAQFGLAEARRSAFSLQPTIIEESGLIDALQKLVERTRVMSSSLFRVGKKRSFGL